MTDAKNFKDRYTLGRKKLESLADFKQYVDLDRLFMVAMTKELQATQSQKPRTNISS